MPADWKNEPSLQGRFDAGSSEELQVILHDGHPSIAGHSPELISVRVTGYGQSVSIFGGKSLAVFRGVVLKAPGRLTTVSKGAEIQFVVPRGCPHPLQVTPQYLQERPSWRLLVDCKECGMSELLSSAWELARLSFPSMSEADLKGFTFTSHCGWCGGAQLVRLMRRRSDVQQPEPEVNAEPLAPVAKEGNLIILRCRTPEEAQLVMDELAKEDIVVISPGDKELFSQYKTEGCVELRVSAEAYEAAAGLASVVEFQQRPLKAQEPLSYPGKAAAMFCGIILVPGLLILVWLLSSYRANGNDRMAKEFKVWFFLGLAAWILVTAGIVLLS